MRSIPSTEARDEFESLLDAAQDERLLITRAGKPSALLVGIESYDEEDLVLASSPEFWRLIEERRHGKSVPLAQVKARLKGKKQKQEPAKAIGSRRRGPKKPGRRPKR